jgi:uncharacterized protein involved in exopolysaccharide biosynthesis
MEIAVSILRMLLQHRIKLVVIPLLTMGLIYHFSKNTPDRFKTESRLFLNLQESKGMSLSDEDLKQYQVHTYFQNTIELLKSKRNAELVQLKLIRKAIESKTVFSEGSEILITNQKEVLQRLTELELTEEFLQPSEFPDSLMLQFLRFHQVNTAKLRELVMAFRIMDSNFIKLEINEISPKRVKALADYFIEALIEENRSLAKNKVKGHKDIIESLLRQAKADLDDKIKRLEKYKVANNIINLGEHTKAIVTYLVQLEGQRATLLTRVQQGKTGKSEVIKSVQQGNELALDLSTHQEILQLKEQLKKMNREMLKKTLGNQTAEDLSPIHQNIDNTKSQIQSKLQELSRKTPYDPSRVQLDLVSKYVVYDLEAETSEDMIHIINDEIQRVMRYSSRFAPFESTIGAYEQEISTAQNAYLVLLNKLNLTQSMEYGSGENIIEVVDPPFLPTKAEPSKRIILILVGGIVMFILMAGILIVIQLLDATITSVDKLERVCSLPILGAIPKQKPAASPSLQAGIDLIRQLQIEKIAQSIVTKPASIIVISSTQREEGTHLLAKQVASCLQNHFPSVGLLDADWTSEELDGFETVRSLVAKHGLYKNKASIQEYIQQQQAQHSVLLVVAPPISLSTDYSFWYSISDSIVHSIGANRIYTKVDQRIEKEILNTQESLRGVVLFHADIENLEEYVGEIPKERGSLRKTVKKVINRNFK